MILRLKAIARRILRPPLHKPEVDLAHDVLGTDYGGWPLLTAHTPADPLIYSFGVGEDISFDLEAIERFGATIHAFDPTPRSRRWVDKQSLPSAFKFHPIGLAAKDGEAEFFAPEVDEYVSFSAQPAALSDPALAIRAPVKRLSTIIDELGTGVPDVLKMDIEGFEYAVLDDLIACDLRPAQLLVEFHHRMYDIENQRTVSQIEKLREAGYRLFYVSDSGHEYGLVHQTAIVA
ncbi:methyltransferase, FkbM family [Sphingopyxis sp. LC81]|uniref:FkbM family methyltransferase n=1 Tax=Sphingopyxis sp. LC81 TaxID=1502850 RepID=UPI0005101923|nr:FkbM family methyltransferase [Sphingopyxis sp. LC81]KGB54075.1 methyltransferase, FkbM family [Sphingopyxis sp. LC81]